jgi:hypothetical protein
MIKMTRSTLIKKIDGLQHDKLKGFYDTNCDMYFDSLNGWAAYHGYNLSLI